MTEIGALLQTIAALLSKTTLRQMSHVIFGMLVASGRITMLDRERWQVSYGPAVLSHRSALEGNALAALSAQTFEAGR